jgi:hypothetical protein
VICRPTRALGGSDSTSGILLIRQQSASNQFAVARVDAVHGLPAVGFDERPIDVVIGDCFHRGSPYEDLAIGIERPVRMLATPFIVTTRTASLLSVDFRAVGT